MYALFKDGKQYSKAHPTKEAATIEAYEKGVVIDYGADFVGDKSGRCLAGGFEIRTLSNDEVTK